VLKKDTINFAPVRSVLAGVISSCDHVGTQYKLNGLEVYSTGAMSPERKPDSRRPMNRKRVNKEVKRLSSQHRVSRLKLEAAWSPLLVAAIVDSLQAFLPPHPPFSRILVRVCDRFDRIDLELQATRAGHDRASMARYRLFVKLHFFLYSFNFKL